MHIRPMDHSQHRLHTGKPGPWSSPHDPGACKSLARGEVRYTGRAPWTYLLEEEQDHCRVAYSKRLRKHNVCDRDIEHSIR